MDNFIDPTKYKEYVIKDGERYISDVLYHDIYALAKSSIHLVDDYISIKTLDLFRNVNKDIKIYIHSDNLAKDKVSDIVLEDFIKDTGLNISIIKSNNKYHDRFILIDDTHLYVCGGSSKDSGYKITTIIEMTNPKVIESIKNEII